MISTNPVHEAIRNALARDVEEFLARGGSIQTVESGYTAQDLFGDSSPVPTRTTVETPTSDKVQDTDIVF